jgi:hypothetical protein
MIELGALPVGATAVVEEATGLGTLLLRIEEEEGLTTELGMLPVGATAPEDDAGEEVELLP